MGNYDIFIQSYEQFLDKDDADIDKKLIQQKINAMKTVNNKTPEEIRAIFNTGAFNDIVKDYFRKAMENCGIEERQIYDVMQELKRLFN